MNNTKVHKAGLVFGGGSLSPLPLAGYRIHTSGRRSEPMVTAPTVTPAPEPYWIHTFPLGGVVLHYTNRRPGPRAGAQPRFSRQLQRSSLLPTGYGIVESHGWTPALRFAPAGVTQRENRAAISMSHKPEPLVSHLSCWLVFGTLASLAGRAVAGASPAASASGSGPSPCPLPEGEGLPGGMLRPFVMGTGATPAFARTGGRGYAMPRHRAPMCESSSACGRGRRRASRRAGQPGRSPPLRRAGFAPR